MADTNGSANDPRADAALRGARAMRELLDRPLDASDLRAQTERIARPVEETQDTGAGVLVFALGGDQLAVAGTAVTRVTRAVRPQRIPHRSNDIIAGLVNVEGELVLCAYLERLLELSPPPEVAAVDDAQRRLVVLGSRDNRWAFHVDRVLGVGAFDVDNERTPPMTVQDAQVRYTSSIVQVDEHPTAVLDADRIVAGFKAALS